MHGSLGHGRISSISIAFILHFFFHHHTCAHTERERDRERGGREREREKGGERERRTRTHARHVLYKRTNFMLILTLPKLDDGELGMIGKVKANLHFLCR